MYCILVSGIPAAGKSTIAERISMQLQLPVFSKDRFKEILFDQIGFASRTEKVKLGTAAMNLMYDLQIQYPSNNSQEASVCADLTALLVRLIR